MFCCIVSRTQELKYLRWRKYLDAVCVVLWATTPVLVLALTLGVHALRRQPLDAPTVRTADDMKRSTLSYLVADSRLLISYAPLNLEVSFFS